MEQYQNNEIDLRKVMRLAKEYWVWFVASVVFFILLGVFYYLRKSPKWTTDASIVLRQKEGGFDDSVLGGLSMLGLTGNSAAEDEVIVLSSRGLMEQSLDALDQWEYNYVKDGLRWRGEFRHPALKIDYIALTEEAQIRPFIVKVKPTKKGYKVTTKRGFFVRSSHRVATLDEPIETAVGTLRIHANRVLSPDTTYRVLHKRRELVVADYRKRTKIALSRKESNIIDLTVTSTLPARDRALLCQMIEQYNINAVVDKNMLASNTAAFIEERLNIIASELTEAEEAVSIYQEKNNIADLQTQAQLFITASSEEQQAIAAIETQLILVDYVDDFLHDETKRHNLLPSNIGITDEDLAHSLAEYNGILLRRLRIKRTATESNPVIEQMDLQLDSRRQNIITTIGTIRDRLRIQLRSMQERDSKFNEQIKNAPEQQRDYVRVVRDKNLKERLYLYLYQKREENALMLAASTMPAKIIDVPQCNILSKRPKLLQLMFVCLILGLAIPTGVLYLLLMFNDKIDDPKEFERRMKAPLLGQLVLNSRKAHIAIHEGESTVSAELFRLIRTNLRFVLPSDVKSPVVLVTSSINGEGKSYVSCNTALSLAMLGKKVVLVGMDLRKPMLATYFNLPNKGHLTDYLAEPDMTLDDIIVPSGEHKNLDLIPCGAIPPNPAELLQTKRVDELFAELRKRYDYIFVDTAPVAMVSDTYLLDRVSDLTLFVSRYKYTPTEMIDYANQMIERERMHNVACVLNAVKGSHGYGYGGQKD